ncbi:hypothetical protein CPB86DRAFT_821088 [Serendipita vermifera]|nr:hypothetical protein CPB86DRAFT_821088 [Serendipita vermifera]
MWKAVFGHQLFQHKPTVNELIDPQHQAQMEATHKGWQTDYVGSSHLLLWQHLKKASSMPEKEEVYAFCSSIVQSSGMGKSRVVTKMSEDHLVIPCCLRTEIGGYPPPDEEARDFLVTKTPTKIDYNMRVQAFLMALLRTVHSTLEEKYGDMPVRGGEKTIAGFMYDLFEAGRSEMSHGYARKQFYETVVGQAEKVHSQGSQLFPY